MDNWQDWSSWLMPGYYISYLQEGARFYEHIILRDLAHYVYEWPETIEAEGTSGPYTPDDLEITVGYNKVTNTNQIWQMIFGIRSQARIYIELPTDLHRHGLPKVPKPSSNNRQVSSFTEYMSPFREPSFLTEHFLMRPMVSRISFDAYNPNAIDLTDLELNIFIAKLVTERIGEEAYGDLSTPSVRSAAATAKLNARWGETLKRLYKRLIPQRPITLQPVRGPPEPVGGQ